jgi:NAD(P)H-hydrate repair Nnr-like enzyme with NAD(P)H-hydrate epimerase domain
MSHALPLYRADAVRAIERAAFARGVDALGLMTQAGEAAAALLRERWPQVRQRLRRWLCRGIGPAPCWASGRCGGQW